MGTNEPVEIPVAKTTFVKKSGEWEIYWQRADLTWHRYDPGTVVKSFEDFLILVDEDEWGCFWG